MKAVQRYSLPRAIERGGGMAVGAKGKRPNTDHTEDVARKGRRRGAPIDKTKPLPPYRPTSLPPKHPRRSPTPNRRGR